MCKVLRSKHTNLCWSMHRWCTKKWYLFHHVLHVSLLIKNVARYGCEKKSYAACTGLILSMISSNKGQFPANSHPSIVDSDSASGNSSDRVRQTTSLLPVHLCQPCCMQRCNTATVLVLRPAATLNHLVLFGAAPRGTVVAFGPWNNCMHTEIPCRSHTFGDCIPISIEHYFFKKNTHSFWRGRRVCLITIILNNLVFCRTSLLEH